VGFISLRGIYLRQTCQVAFNSLLTKLTVW